MPTVEYTIASQSADAIWQWFTGIGGILSDTDPNAVRFDNTSPEARTHCWMRFAGVTIPDGATIDVATVTWSNIVRGPLGVGSAAYLYGNDTDAPTDPADATAAENKVLTTAKVAIALASFPAANTAPGQTIAMDVADVITELLASYSYAAGRDLAIIGRDESVSDAGNVYGAFGDSFDSNPTSGFTSPPSGIDPPVLHIEYTPGGGGGGGAAEATSDLLIASAHRFLMD